MKKLLLLQILFISSVIAEEGLERVIDKSKMSACDKAKSKAYASYEIFRMNSDCFCKNTDTQEWTCDLYFNYIRKKDITN